MNPILFIRVYYIFHTNHRSPISNIIIQYLYCSLYMTISEFVIIGGDYMRVRKKTPKSWYEHLLVRQQCPLHCVVMVHMEI